MLAWLAMIAAAASGQSAVPPPSGASASAAQAGAAPTVGGDYANLLALFSTDDYPAEAIRRGEQGTVGVRLSLNDDGRVARCDVTSSSGSAILDRTTCSIIQRRGRFPAGGDRGESAKNHYTTRIRWVLPAPELQSFEDKSYRVVFSIDGSESLGACRLEGPPPMPNIDVLCAEVRPRAESWLTRSRGSLAIASGELVFENGLIIGSPEAAAEIGSRPGETRVGGVSFNLSVDADGKIVGCRAIAPFNPAEAATFCAMTSGGRFVPLGAEVANRSVRNAIRYFVTYTRPKP